MVSIGSGSEHFRMTFQPWIEAAVFRPLATRSVSVLHHELVAGPGVDIAGDLTDPGVLDRIATSASAPSCASTSSSTCRIRRRSPAV